MNIHELIDKIRRHIARGENVASMLDDLIASTDPHIYEPLLLSILGDKSLDDTARSYPVYMCWHCTSPEMRRALRVVVHDPREPKVVRLAALDALSIMGDELLHVDLCALLADPAQPTWLRAHTADKIGGTGLSTRLVTLLDHVLADPNSEPEVLFWCLYASATAPPGERMRELVTSFLDDQRAIPLKFGERTHATLAEEAVWALAKLNGVKDIEPAWAMATSS